MKIKHIKLLEFSYYDYDYIENKEELSIYPLKINVTDMASDIITYIINLKIENTLNQFEKNNYLVKDITLKITDVYEEVEEYVEIIDDSNIHLREIYNIKHFNKYF